MDTLPGEILNEICNFLSLKDISNLQYANRTILTLIGYNYECILTKQLNCKPDTKNIIQSKKMFYDFLKYHLDVNCHRYKTMIYNYYSSRFLFIQRANLKYYILIFKNYYNHYNSTGLLENLSNQNVVNNIYDRIFDFYINNDFRHLEQYDNKLELLVLYNLMIDNIDSLFEFLKTLDSCIFYDKYYYIKIKYYRYVLNVLHYNHYIIFNNTFQKLYQMSPYITSICGLKKMFGYNVLDLQYCEFINCDECAIPSIHYICDLKMNFFKDDLISYNYTQIKDLLQRRNVNYYNILLERETFLVNNIIYVKNHTTNRRMRVNGFYYKNFISSISRNDKKNCTKIQKFIKRKQESLKIKFFT